ncbi:hypothetical protein BWQ96_02201 [Gracilariopsis chorda]|uniref:SAP domain-containing protein n=1 Tax=Gracilariopsis chorda TaxID=448386 RepID=A0A2V3J3P9_9FLOR|nr:hypothetical protein BWQ96_02201 [Gracilariopsis chorda]|eukprot:PXF48010.1 hypothetical protein BWQ96_02201 [Gracilariopsis chorda]
MKLSKMRVADLRKELKRRGLDDKGTRPSLMKRLRDAMENDKKSTEEQAQNASNASIKHDAQPTEPNSTREYSDDRKKQRPNRLTDTEDRSNREHTEKAQNRTYERKGDDRRRYRRDDEHFDDDKRVLEENSRRNASHVKRQHREASDEEKEALEAPSSEDQALPVPETRSNEPEAKQNKTTGTENESSTPERGVKDLTQNGKPGKASHSPSKVNATCNIQNTRDTPTDERMRRRLERFGTVEKTETTDSLSEDEAIRRRRERFGIVSSSKTAEESGANKMDKSAKSEADQHEVEAAKRRRALKFGLESKKRDFSDAGLSPDEIEKRLKRQRRFQNVC